MNPQNYSTSNNDNFDNGLGQGVATLLLGTLIGAAAALLLAPKSGRELREDVASRAGTWKAQAAEAISQGRERFVSSVEDAEKR